MHFTSCNSTVTLHSLMTGMYFFYFKKKNIYFSCSTYTASSNITRLHALSAEATAVVLGGKERGSAVIWKSATTQKSSAGPRGNSGREWVPVWRSAQRKGGTAAWRWDLMAPQTHKEFRLSEPHLQPRLSILSLASALTPTHVHRSQPRETAHL